MVPIAMGYKEKNEKKGDVVKIFSGKSAMKWISKNLPYGRW